MHAIQLITLIILLLVLTIWILIKKKNQQITPNYTTQLFVGYIPSNIPGQQNAIVFDMDYTANTVSTITVGYSVTSVTPEKGITTDNTFNCVFADIIQNTVVDITFVKNGIYYDVTIVSQSSAKNPPNPIQFSIRNYNITDASIAYNTIINKKQTDQHIITDNQTVFIGYIGSSNTEALNIIILDINSTTNTVSTLDNKYNSISALSDSVSSASFSVTFPDSFIGSNLIYQLTAGQPKYYTVMVNNISFPVQPISVNDIAKMYSVLLDVSTNGKLSSIKSIHNFSNLSHRNTMKQFIKQYKATKMTQTDFMNKTKLLQHVKNSLTNKIIKQSK